MTDTGQAAAKFNPQQQECADLETLVTMQLALLNDLEKQRTFASNPVEKGRLQHQAEEARKLYEEGRDRYDKTCREAPPVLPEICEKYLECLIEHCGNLEARGIPQTVKQVTLPLDEVYVSLTAERDTERIGDVFGQELDEVFQSIFLSVKLAGEKKPLPRQSDEQRRSLAQKTISEKVDLPKAIRDHAKAVVLGDPGAGKTTLMKFLATRFATACQKNDIRVTDKEGNDYGETRLPILLRVADFAKALRTANPPSLRDFLAASFSNMPEGRAALPAVFEDALKNGKAFVLLDGLDEVAQAADRVEISRQIDAFATYSETGNRLLVTSRVAGYREARLNSAFAQFTLRDMERDQIQQFLTRWCVAVERSLTPTASPERLTERGHGERDAILAEIDGNEGVRRLAKNPLLLTILALIHRNGAKLPKRRIELYELATKTLLRDWRLHHAGSEARIVEEHEALELLGPLAYWMHENEPTGLMEEKDVRDKLREWHGEAHGKVPNHPDIRAAIEDFLQRVREHTGLFVERAPGKYGFMHLTFEEYFAAREMISDPLTAAQRIAPFRHKPRWEEPIRLAIAFERPKQATRLLRTAILAEDATDVPDSIQPSEYEDILHRDFLLAVRCFADCESVEPKLLSEIAARLTALALRQDETANYEPLRQMVLALLPPLKDSETGAEISTALLAALKDKAKNVRLAAAQALGQIGQATPEITATLLAAIKDEDRNVRYYAAQALGQIGNAAPPVIDALLALLKDEEGNVRSAAAQALGQIGNAAPPVMDALLAAFKDKDRTVREAAAQALGQIGNAAPPVIDALLALLNDEEGNVRSAAAQALGQIGNAAPPVMDALFALLKDEEGFVRYYAARALGQIGNATPPVMDALLALLKDKDRTVREAAAQALGQIGNAAPPVIDALLALLNDEQWTVRYYAAQALGQIGNAAPPVIYTLLTLLKDKDRTVRSAAARALGQIGQDTPEVTAALLTAIKDKEGFVRDTAWQALWDVLQKEAGGMTTPQPPPS